MYRVLPLLTIVLAVATFVVLGMTEKPDTRALGEAAGRINNIEERTRKAAEAFETTSATLRNVETRADALSAKVEESMKTDPPPTDKEIADRTAGNLDLKWDEFIAKAYLAEGRIGVIQPSDNRTIKALGDSIRRDLEKLGVRGAGLDAAARTAAETIVMYNHARNLLRSQKGALEIERRRLLAGARTKLSKDQQKYHVDRVMHLLEGRMRH